jgi:uncharacterized membrane protein
MKNIDHHDNVRPLRPPPPPKKFNVRDPETIVRLAYCFTLVSFTVIWLAEGTLDPIGIGVGFAAVAIAASRQDEPPAWLGGHHRFTLRTIVIAAVVWTLASLLTFAPQLREPVKWTFGTAVWLWVMVRSGVGLWRAVKRRPQPDPLTLLI